MGHPPSGASFFPFSSLGWLAEAMLTESLVKRDPMLISDSREEVSNE